MEQKLVSDLLNVYLIQTESAFQISKIISEHSGNEKITPDDFITGLIYRLLIPMEDEEYKSSSEIIKTIFESDESDESDEGFDILNDISDSPTVQEENDIVIFSRKIIKNNCNCDICGKARACLINYPKHTVKNQLEQKFKDSIDNALIIHKLYL